MFASPLPLKSHKFNVKVSELLHSHGYESQLRNLEFRKSKRWLACDFFSPPDGLQADLLIDLKKKISLLYWTVFQRSEFSKTIHYTNILEKLVKKKKRQSVLRSEDMQQWDRYGNCDPTTFYY